MNKKQESKIRGDSTYYAELAKQGAWTRRRNAARQKAVDAELVAEWIETGIPALEARKGRPVRVKDWPKCIRKYAPRHNRGLNMVKL